MPAPLDTLRLRPGDQAGIADEGGRLVVEPQTRPRYTLDELLSLCSPRKALSREEREWLKDKPAGTELL